MKMLGWVAAIVVALAMAAASVASAEIDAEATQDALDEVKRIRNEAHATGGYVVTHQVNGRSVYTIVSQQSLENQITLAILNGEMTVDEAPDLVRAMQALTSNSMENLRESESALSSMLDQANADADYWARIDGSYRDRYGSVPVGPSRPQAERGYRLSDGPTYRPERGSRRSGRAASGASSSGRSASGRSAGGYASSGRSSGGYSSPGRPSSARASSGRSSYSPATDSGGRSARADRGKDRKAKGADRRTSSPSYPSAPADDGRRKRRRDRVS